MTVQEAERQLAGGHRPWKSKQDKARFALKRRRGRLGRLPREGGLQTDTQRRHPLPEKWEEAMKAEKGENKQLPLCLLPAKVRRAQKNATKG